MKTKINENLSIEVGSIVIVEKAITDESGKISLIGIFNTLKLYEKISYVTVVPFAIYSTLKREDKGFPERGFNLIINVISPTGKLIVSAPIAGKFREGEDKVRFIAHYGATTFTEDGKYKIELLFNGIYLESFDDVLKIEKVPGK